MHSTTTAPMIVVMVFPESSSCSMLSEREPVTFAHLAE